MGDDVRVRRVTDTPQVLQPTPPLEGETARPTSRSGGIGDADANLQEMLKVQEVA